MKQKLSVIFLQLFSLCCCQKPSDHAPLQTTYEPTQVRPVNTSDNGRIHFSTYLLYNKGDFAKVPPVSADKYEELNIFCYEGVAPSVTLFWSSAALKLNLSNHNYEVYVASNTSGVVSLAELRESEWFYSALWARIRYTNGFNKYTRFSSGQ